VRSSDSPAATERRRVGAVSPEVPRFGAKRRRLRAVELAVGGSGLALGAVSVALAATAFHHQAQPRHVFDLAGLSVAYPSMNVAAAVLLPLAALGLAVLFRVVRASARERRRQRAFLGALTVVGSVPGDPSAVVVAGEDPVAFCAGWRRPRVYVSAGAVARLGPAELRAVLAHERQHVVARDPLRLAVTRVLREALFFLPVLRPLEARQGTLAELAADAAAVGASAGDVKPVASAMLALGGGGERLGGAAGGGGLAIAPERVDHLLGERPSWRPPTLALLAALLTVAGATVALWLSARAASAGATLALPGLSRQPCVLVLALVPLLAAATGLRARQRPPRAWRST